jgi:hypothetical protein
VDIIETKNEANRTRGNGPIVGFKAEKRELDRLFKDRELKELVDIFSVNEYPMRDTEALLERAGLGVLMAKSGIFFNFGVQPGQNP